MNAAHRTSWFRGAAGRRYGVDMAVIVLIKLALLVALYLAVVAPQPRPDTSPASMRRHVIDPSPLANEHGEH